MEILKKMQINVFLSETITIECPICTKTLTFDKEYEADG